MSTANNIVNDDINIHINSY